jgi:HEAT repeat protein
MGGALHTLLRLGPAALVLKAIVAAIVADALLLGFILLRRTYRKRYFQRHDALVFEFRGKWEALVSGEIPYDNWRRKTFTRRIVESLALDAFEVAGPQESSRLLQFLRSSGLIRTLVFEAQQQRGWRRQRALVALGRTRAPEGIPALGEALRDRSQEIRLAALRGLSRAACPEAGAEILCWVGEAGLAVPPLPLQSALIQCCAERPQLLLPYLQHAEAPVREVLGRVLGEVATPSLGAELLRFAQDDSDELRAASARALCHAPSAQALEVLGELARDPVWFVRLRAIVSLGQLRDARAVPHLLRGLTDANRLIRLRAAEGLEKFETEVVPIFEQVVAAGDQYGLHAFLTAIGNSGRRPLLESALAAATTISASGKMRLLKVLDSGSLAAQPPVSEETAAVRIAAPL